MPEGTTEVKESVWQRILAGYKSLKSLGAKKPKKKRVDTGRTRRGPVVPQMSPEQEEATRGARSGN